MAVSKRLRYEILRRDNHACRYCGAKASEVKLTVDHVVPQSLGGSDDPDNLAAACTACNGGKAASNPDAPLVKDVSADALRWAAAIKAAAEDMLSDLDRRDLARAEFDEAWSKWGMGSGSNRRTVPRPDDWGKSVDAFLAAGLPMPVLLDCVHKAMSNKKLQVDHIFRYVCGIAWKKITEIQESARERLAAEDAPAGDGRAETYELMYRELVGHVFGMLGYVESEADEKVYAAAQREEWSEDEDLTVLDDAGLAAVQLVRRMDDTLALARQALDALVGKLSEDEFRCLYDLAVDWAEWPEQIRIVDKRRSQFLAMVTTQMAAWCALADTCGMTIPELIDELVGPREEQRGRLNGQQA